MEEADELLPSEFREERVVDESCFVRVSFSLELPCCSAPILPERPAGTVHGARYVLGPAK